MIQNNQAVEFIIYVADQQKSKEFYEKILGYEPVLDVPGMTQFLINEGCKLGLTPESWIAKILNGKTKNPAAGNGIPRCEIYLMVDNPAVFHELALQLGAKNISDVADRDWGHKAAYVQDFDGHIVAFAKAL